MTVHDNLDRGVKFKYNSSGAKAIPDPMTVLVYLFQMQLIQTRSGTAGGVKFGAIEGPRLVMVLFQVLHLLMKTTWHPIVLPKYLHSNL